MPAVRRFLLVAGAAVAAAACGVGIVATTAPAPLPFLDAEGIGAVHFGEQTAIVVRELYELLGRPSAAQPSSGCGPRYAEVEWGDLAAEFRLGVLSGYRYLDGGLLGDDGSVARLEALRVAPRLTTATGITLGSTLGQARAAFGRLTVVGTNRSEAEDGFVFYDDARAFPDPASSRIVEIKIATCGDY
jgi:hypothetical protein